MVVGFTTTYATKKYQSTIQLRMNFYTKFSYNNDIVHNYLHQSDQFGLALRVMMFNTTFYNMEIKTNVVIRKLNLHNIYIL
jgi:hypothetical protein